MYKQYTVLYYSIENKVIPCIILYNEIYIILLYWNINTYSHHLFSGVYLLQNAII